MSRVERPLEASVELAAIAWAHENDWLTRKLKWIGRRNAPDRIFAKNGRVVFVEFKRPGERPRITQDIEIGRMRSAGLEVHVVSLLAEFHRIMRMSPYELARTKNLSSGADDRVSGIQLPKIPRRRV